MSPGDNHPIPGGEPFQPGADGYAEGGSPSEEAEEIPGFNPEDEVIPPSPVRRRLAMTLALLFLAGILLFLIVFIATNWQRSPG